MKKYLRLTVIYALIAVAVVVLYAPWALNLRPWDYSLLRAGASIIAGIALAGTFATSTYLTLKEPDVKLLEPGDVTSDDEVLPVLQEYADTPVVGGLASDALEQVRSASRKRGRLHKLIEAQFSRGSLSWERFTHLVDTAQRTVLRNASLVANNVQSFDREGYEKARRSSRHGSTRSVASTDGLRNEQLALFDQSLADTREIISANERVLLELGKLELELSKLDANDQLEDNSQTVEELQTLIQETRYYR